MIYKRAAFERGHFNHGWLNTYHTFSFSEYNDPRFMGFRSLRVINEDWVSPGKGFGTHPHRDMEIITYILEGALEHKDSMGNGSIIRPNDIQRMSAGTGITHSEANPSPNEQVHLLQIWLFPEKHGITPSYEQQTVPIAERTDTLKLVAAKEGGVVTINQDAKVYASVLNPNKELSYTLKSDRFAWIQVARGSVIFNDIPLSQGDGAAVGEEEALRIRGGAEQSEFLLFDLA